MRQIGLIFNKEFKSFFVSPAAYIVIAVFLLITGWFFFTPFFIVNQANLRSFFVLLPLIFSFIIPAVTMRLFAEEINAGSYETLLTMPVTFGQVILGKYLASVCFIVAMLLPTLAYPLTVSFLGELDWGPVFGGYAGAVLLGGAFCSAGIFASSLTRNQIVAFITGMTICFTLTIIDKMLFFLPGALLGVVQFIGADFHFQNIAKGIIDSRDIIYFLSLIFIGLYCTYLGKRN